MTTDKTELQGQISTNKSDISQLQTDTLKQSDMDSIISQIKTDIIEEMEKEGHITIDIDGGDLDVEQST